MILFPAITITDATPFTFKRNVRKPVTGNIKHLIAWVDSGSSTVYCGNEPGPAVVIPDVIVRTSNTIGISPVTVADVPSTGLSFRSVKIGYVWSSASDDSDDGKYVIGVDDDLVLMNAAMVTNLGIALGTFTPPDVTATNGLPIGEGGERQWTSAVDSPFLENPIKFVVDTGGTATLRIAYEM